MKDARRHDDSSSYGGSHGLGTPSVGDTGNLDPGVGLAECAVKERRRMSLHDPGTRGGPVTGSMADVGTSAISMSDVRSGTRLSIKLLGDVAPG